MWSNKNRRQRILGFTRQKFAAEFVDDVFAFFLGLHACEADAAADALVVSQNAR